MTEAKFTPGPWAVQGRRIGPFSKSDDQSYMMIDQVAYIEDYDWPQHYEANAHLIAAAPEMYSLLDEAVNTIDRVSYHEDVALGQEWIDEAKAALAKARGEV